VPNALQRKYLTPTANGLAVVFRPHRSAGTRDLVSAGDIICMNRLLQQLSRAARNIGLTPSRPAVTRYASSIAHIS